MKKIITTLLCSIILLCNASGFSQNFDVRTKSNVTAEQLNRKFKNKLSGTGKYFVEMERKYNVNAVFLASIAIHESGNGSSRPARRKNNFFGLTGKRGLLSFKTPEESIECVARNISKSGGNYYGKGRYTISSIGKRYASSRKWSSRIVSTMKTLR